MNHTNTSAISFVAVLGLCTHLATVRAQNALVSAKGAQHDIPALRDEKHDFDFEVGTWRAHVKKLVHPLTGSQEWDDLFGTVVTRSLPMLEGWNESEMTVDSPRTHTHIELLAVRL